jgi:hypothetical protein
VPYVTDWLVLVNRKKRDNFGISEEGESVLANAQETLPTASIGKAMCWMSEERVSFLAEGTLQFPFG